MLPRGFPYPVTKDAVKAIERGMRRKGVSKAELARELGVTAQAVGQALAKADTGACEFLPQMLQAVGEEELLAFPGLNDMQTATLQYLQDLKGEMSAEDRIEFLHTVERAWRDRKR